MSTYQKCDKSVSLMADEILHQFETHKPLLDAGVTVDFVFAYADVDEETGTPVGHAIMHNGYPAGGVCRKVSLKDRAMDRADAEITLDGDNWKEMIEEERRALLDHELHHIAVKIDKRGLKRDDLGRPVLQLRKHSVQFGWFKEVAERHGVHSQERLQARQIMGLYQMYFWPELPPVIEQSTPENTSMTLRTAGHEVTVTAAQAGKAIANINRKLGKGKA